MAHNVKQKYRKNPLSLIDGGTEVKVTFINGDWLTYDKVKSPQRYIPTIKREGVRKIEWFNKQLGLWIEAKNFKL